MVSRALMTQFLSACPILPPKDNALGQVADETGQTWLQVKADQAKAVQLAIYDQVYDFKKNDVGIWRLAYPMSDGITMVQLRIDEQDVLTPYLPIGYGYSRPYNYVALDTDEASFYDLADVPHGTIHHEYLKSQVTGNWERCLVYTTPGYDAQTDTSYPVLYLQHGHGENEIGWTSQGKVNFILDNLLAKGTCKPFIVVMSNGMVQVTDASGQTVVDHTLFESYLLKDVIPTMEGKYRIIGDRDNRAMAGLSMGSIQTSVVTFNHPELFSQVGLFSGFLHDFIQGHALMDMVKRDPSDNAHLMMLTDANRFLTDYDVFFRAIGEQDIFIAEFEADNVLLDSKNILDHRNLYKGGHDWNVWRKCIRDFAPLLFQDSAHKKHKSTDKREK